MGLSQGGHGFRCAHLPAGPTGAAVCPGVRSVCPSGHSLPQGGAGSAMPARCAFLPAHPLSCGHQLFSPHPGRLSWPHLREGQVKALNGCGGWGLGSRCQELQFIHLTLDKWGWQAAGSTPHPSPELLLVTKGYCSGPMSQGYPLLPTLNSSGTARGLLLRALLPESPTVRRHSPNNHKQWQRLQGWRLEGEGDTEALAQVPLPDSSRDATQYQLQPDGQTGVMLG